jgi:carbamoyl-phosphate synthase large subunit
MKIAVTGLNATDNPGPGVPVIRSILASNEFKGEIIGLIYDSLDPGIYMKDIHKKCYLIPYPSTGLEILFQRIKEIHDKEKIDLIIPTLDSELYGFIKIQSRLAELGIKTFLPTIEQLNFRGKDKLFDFCSAHKIKVPKNVLASSIQDIYSLKKDFDYPVVVKGIFYDAYICNNFEEVVTAFEKISMKWGYPIIIQEYVRGDEYNVVALGDGTGATVGAVSMRKLYITDKGKGWAGITIDDKAILEISRKLIKELKWRSGMELEFIKDSETGEYYLLEINPRFPAWVFLAPSAGQNLPYSLVKLATGEKVEPFTSFSMGTIFVRSSWDLITDIKVFEKIATTGEIENG